MRRERIGGLSVTNYYLGWDVGGWNCDRNRNSRDALAVLGVSGSRIGETWRGNLRSSINESGSTHVFLKSCLMHCGVNFDPSEDRVTVAIDAPLAFPVAFAELLAGGVVGRELGKSAENPYLFRFTERRLSREGVTPLSAVKDMIGSQATKAMHVVSRFFPCHQETGVWSDGFGNVAIETYPSLCRFRAPDLFASADGKEAHDDVRDAMVCAVVARTFSLSRSRLEPPEAEAPVTEGWIWSPISG
jgi:predicted nuclease with RNAse H fold